MICLGATITAARSHINICVSDCHFPFFFFSFFSLCLIVFLILNSFFFSDVLQISYPGSDSSAKKSESERSIQGCQEKWMSPQANDKTFGDGILLENDHKRNCCHLASLTRTCRISHNLLFSCLQVIFCKWAMVEAGTLHVSVIFTYIQHFFSVLYIKVLWKWKKNPNYFVTSWPNTNLF